MIDWRNGPIACAQGDNVSYLRDDTLTEWYVNDGRGLEQGWTLDRRPPRADAAVPLRLDFAVRGSLLPQLFQDGTSVTFPRPSRRGGPHLRRSQGLGLLIDGAPWRFKEPGNPPAKNKSGVERRPPS
jgi:hypothetical protein